MKRTAVKVLALALCFMLCAPLLMGLCRSAEAKAEAVPAVGEGMHSEKIEKKSIDLAKIASLEPADLTLDDVLNVPGGDIHFVSEGETPFVPMEYEDMDFAVSTAYDSYHSSYLDFTLHMTANSLLSFEYYVQPGDHGNGTLYFAVNDTSDYPGDTLPDEYYDGWMRFVYIAPSDGYYAFHVGFGCNASDGDVFAALDNFEYSLNGYEPDYADALNGDGMDLSYVSYGSHMFGIGMIDDTWFVGSTNDGEPNSVSALTSSYFAVKEHDVLYFDYLVTPCAEDDHFLARIGRAYLPVWGAEADGEWHTKEWEFDSSQEGSINLGFQFVKGSTPGDGSEGAVVANVRLVRASSNTLDDVLNVEGGSIEFANYGNNSFEPVYGNDRIYAEVQNGEGTLGFDVHMQAGSALSFDYRPNYTDDDFFSNGFGAELTVNGASVNFTPEKLLIARQWTSYMFVAPEEGDYSFRLRAYMGQGSSFAVDEFAYIPDPVDADISGAVNVSGGALEFVTFGTMPFAVRNQGGRTYARSTNFDGFYTVSVLRSLPVQLNAEDTLVFDYKADGAANNYFGFYANEALVLFTNTMDNDNAWHSFTFTAEESRTYEFEWLFWKDGDDFDTATDCIMIDEIGVNRADAAAPASLNEALNVPGGTLSFVTGGDQPFAAQELFGRSYALSGAEYTEDGQGTLETTVQLVRDDTITFEYRATGIRPGCGLKFYINGELCLNTALEALPDSWVRFAFVVPEDGEYELRWECLRVDPVEHTEPFQQLIDNVSVFPAYDEALGAALNTQGGSIRFAAAGTDLFTAAEFEGRDCAGLVPVSDFVSNGSLFNAQLHSDGVYLEAGQALVFDYYLDFWEDHGVSFGLLVNGETVYQTIVESYLSMRWCQYAFVARETGWYNFTWQCRRLFGGTFGAVMIDNVHVDTEYEGPGLPGDGDVDCNGTVTVSDAILALRSAMGIYTLTEEQISHADVNGDGNVTVSDAIMILRIAMGIA